MLDFEDVTPRKRDMEENGEEQNENTAEEMEMNHSAEEEHPEEAAVEETVEEVTETEPAPQPSVREYHYEEQVKKACAVAEENGGGVLFVTEGVIGVTGEFSPLDKIVELKERNYTEAEKFDYAPLDFEDAMDNYDKVLEIVGDICGNIVAENAERLKEAEL